MLLPEVLASALQYLQLPLLFAPPARPTHQAFQLHSHFAHHPTDLQALLINHNAGPSGQLAMADPLVIKTKFVKVQKPRSRAAFEAARQRGRVGGFTGSIEWEDDEVVGPGTSFVVLDCVPCSEIATESYVCSHAQMSRIGRLCSAWPR